MSKFDPETGCNFHLRDFWNELSLVFFSHRGTYFQTTPNKLDISFMSV